MTRSSLILGGLLTAILTACGGAYDPSEAPSSIQQAATFQRSEVSIEVDEDGFITDPNTWSEDVASALAKTEDVSSLTKTHWSYVYAIRAYYTRYQTAPSTRYLYATTTINPTTAATLFANGALGACKVAGVPAKPCYAAYTTSAIKLP